MKKLLLVVVLHMMAVQAAEPAFYPASSYGNQEIQAMFQDTLFSQSDISIRSVPAYMGEGEITFKFGCADHIRKSLQDGIIIDAANTYYLLDPSATSFGMTQVKGQMSIGNVVVVDGKNGLKLSGHIKGKKGAVVYIPDESDVSKLGICAAALKHIPLISDRRSLLCYFDDPNRAFGLKLRTNDADLFNQEIKDREGKVLDHTKLFVEYHPELQLVSDESIKIRTTQALTSSSRVIVKAGSKEDVGKLLQEYPVDSPVRFIDPNSAVGLYSGMPLTLINCDEITTSGILIVLGFYSDKSGKLILDGQQGLALLSPSIVPGYGCSFKATKFVAPIQLDQIQTLEIMKLIPLSLYTKLLDTMKRLDRLDDKVYQSLLKRRQTLDEENGEMKLTLDDVIRNVQAERH